ncbi:hypothetical protein AN639_06675 [Candidatus Epulonipiscium fishelsonii]|uniref:Uncharacterized protein n=1 Tax=Candidatus Epulonipiscium fishelsonii TaxID=77094 RepID=A0ACC8XH33_9FIRM|nr:hypothetical protein AN639_06675 [Epulopiscium sp. SCG-B05WGA-EpuloA1]ONI42779.1 hypothetical protein AN396_13355 [Epulopiscium sp. SCG-B11WGA-EpuloA1]
MKKFFVYPEQIIDDKITIDGSDYNHIINVFRLKIKDKLLINDRQGNEFICIITSVGKLSLIATIEHKFIVSTEPKAKITLFQSLIKAEKMELVLQKSVELGVYQIIPIITDRCVVKLETSKMENKISRWKKIIEAASKQSGRNLIPEIKYPINFNEVTDYTNETDLNIIPYEKENKISLKNILETKLKENINVVIGPEGGFTEEEIYHIKSNNFNCVTLGKRILRSETATLTVIANIMYELNE